MRQYTMWDKEVWCRFVKNPGEVIEVHAKDVSRYANAWSGYARGTVVGYFDNHEAFCQKTKLLKKVDDQLKNVNIFFTLQVIDPELLSRAVNRMVPAKETTNDKNVLSYRWVPIDLDPVRPAGIPSSDEELEHALRADSITDGYEVKINDGLALEINGRATRGLI